MARGIEGELLGWRHPPLAVAFEETLLEPDSLGSWCPRCGQTAGPRERTRRGCGSCRGTPTSLNGMVRLGPYRGDLARRILEVKHGRWVTMARALGRRLGEQTLASAAASARPVAIVPVPMPWLRRWWRGIDHTHEIAVGAAAVLKVPVVAVLRQRNGGTQVRRSRTDRRRATERFEAAIPPGRWPSVLRQGGPVAVLDDVRTTGATLEQVARLLRTGGVEEILGMVLAVVANPRRREVPQVGEGIGRSLDEVS